MDFGGFPTALTAAFFLSGSAALVLLDYCLKASRERRDIALTSHPQIDRTAVSPMAPSSPTAPCLPPVTIDAPLLERIASSKRAVEPPSIVEPSRETIFEVYSPAADKRRSGMISQSDFDALLERETQFQGLVVSIGINDADSSMWYSPRFLQQVGSHFADLLEDKDYCRRTAFDEFVLVCPGERGAEGQRRLRQISERLWDFQLRGRAAGPILFSWGAAQVEDRPLAEAVADATDLMRQSKRNSPSEAARSRAV